MKRINFMPDETPKASGLQLLLIKCVVLVVACGLVVVVWQHQVGQRLDLADRELGLLDQQVQAARAKAQQAAIGATKQLGQSKQVELHDKLKRYSIRTTK